MNKQELIESIAHLPSDCSRPRPMIDKLTALELIKLLEEPQKVAIPQFVADWIEKVGDKLFGLNYDSVPSEIYDWVYGEEEDLNKLHLACAIGYTVEKEKRYTVKMKGVNEECEHLVFGELSNTWKLRSLGSFGELRKHHTRKELEEAGFGEVFNSPLFEVEEVEE